MKALSLTVHKLWPRLKFLKSSLNFKVKDTRSKIMKWCERSCHKEYIYEIWKPCLSRFISYKFWKRRSNFKVLEKKVKLQGQGH